MKNSTLPLYIAVALLSYPAYASHTNTKDNISATENRTTITSQDTQATPPDAAAQMKSLETSKRRHGMRVDNRSQSDPSLLGDLEKNCTQKKTG